MRIRKQLSLDHDKCKGMKQEDVASKETSDITNNRLDLTNKELDESTI